MRHLLTPSKICTPEYIYTRVFLAHANWTLLFVSKLHLILNPMRTGHELERSMIVFFGNLVVCFCVLLKTYEIYSYKRDDSISYKMFGKSPLLRPVCVTKRSNT